MVHLENRDNSGRMRFIGAPENSEGRSLESFTRVIGFRPHLVNLDMERCDDNQNIAGAMNSNHGGQIWPIVLPVTNWWIVEMLGKLINAFDKASDVGADRTKQDGYVGLMETSRGQYVSLRFTMRFGKRSLGLSQGTQNGSMNKGFSEYRSPKDFSGK
nr:hypothetical protein Iba_chr14cCG0490 [Ipomoea batatas]